MNSLNTVPIVQDYPDAPLQSFIDLTYDLVALDAADLVNQERLFARIDEELDVFTPAEVEVILADPRFGDIKDQLHERRARYEYDREVLLAREIIAENDAGVAEDFRSHDWYDKALDFETNALKAYNLKRILFVGSGPFPTSPMAFLRNNPDAEVTCMERFEEACALAEKVTAIFGQSALEILNVDGAQVTDFSAYDCVIVGLVVGANDQDKQPVVEHFLKAVPKETLLCFRSADGPGKVIYPSVDTKALQDYDIDVLESPPHKSFTMIIVKR